MKFRQFSVVVPPVVGMLLSISAAAQVPIALDQPASMTGRSMEPTMIPVVRYPDETYAFPYSCYRVRRCSVYDLYRFRDRPNRLTRLAPEAPLESDELPPPIAYLWFFVPITPEENILPTFRTASQVRDEYRSVGRAIDDPD